MSTEITNPPEGRVASFPVRPSDEPTFNSRVRPETHEVGWCPDCIEDGGDIRGTAASVIEWAQRLREEVEENKELDDVLISV
jgi:hypothetical protein